MNKIFAKTLETLFLGHFLDFLSPTSQAHPNYFSKTGILHFSYFMMWNFMEKK